MKNIDHHVPVNCSGRPVLEAPTEDAEEPPPADAPDSDQPSGDHPPAKEDPKPKPKKDSDPKAPRPSAPSGLKGGRKRKGDETEDPLTNPPPNVPWFRFLYVSQAGTLLWKVRSTRTEKRHIYSQRRR